MTYNFKDLMALGPEAIGNGTEYRDYTNINESDIPAELKGLAPDQPTAKLATWILEKGIGKDVRLALALAVQWMNVLAGKAKQVAERTQIRQDNLEDQTARDVAQMEAEKDAVIANATVDSEVILARGGKATLGQRLDETATQLAQTRSHELSYINLSKPPYNLTAENLDGVQDVINQALTDYGGSGKTLYIPHSENPYMINVDVAIQMTSDINMVIDDGVVFKAIPTSNTNYRIFNVKNVENVHVRGRFTLLGERDEHLGTGGEWGMGIEIRGSKNIYFEHVTANDFWGDGFYIGSTPEKNHSENIQFDTMMANNNRRQGLSVISVRGLKIGKAILNNTMGISPEAGVDFEPNNNEEYLEDIVIDELYTSKNNQNGILSYLGAYIDSPNEVSIWIKKHVSHEDEIGATFVGGGGIKGVIQIDNAHYLDNNNYGFNIRRYALDNPRIVLNNPTIINPTHLVESTLPRYKCAIIINMMEHDTLTGFKGEKIGNVEINNPKIISTQTPNKLLRGIHVENQKFTDQAEKISIINPIQFDTVQDNMYNRSVHSVVSDINNVLVKHMNDEDIIMTHDQTITTQGNTDTRTITIGATYSIGRVVEIVVENNNRLNISTGNAFHPIKSFNTTLYSTKQGSRLKIKKVKDNQWEVLSVVGEWLEE